MSITPPDEDNTPTPVGDGSLNNDTNGRHKEKFITFINQLDHYEDCILALNLINIKLTEFDKNV